MLRILFNALMWILVFYGAVFLWRVFFRPQLAMDAPPFRRFVDKTIRVAAGIGAAVLSAVALLLIGLIVYMISEA